jgi:hypothetical protein
MSTEPTSRARVLEAVSDVATGYRHAPKQVGVGEPIAPPDALLKWYEVHPVDRPVPSEIRDLARAHVLSPRLEAKGPGFVILHRCGDAFYFLIVTTWKNDNEAWETVFYKDGDGMRDFALFPRESSHKPTFCVWELVPVWHEQKAWVRYLESARDETAAERWLRDLYTGTA